MKLSKNKLKKERVILTFHTTSDAMIMEKVCKKLEVSGRLIPIPRTISASCGLAWCSDVELKDKLKEIAENEKIEVEGIYEILK